MPKLFLMRWNPAISSYKLDVYHQNCKDFPDGFRIDWSVWNYDEAQYGDFFIMMRVGEYKPGIVFYGSFVSNPYSDDDWAGSDKKRHYVLMDCFGFTEDDEPIISEEDLLKEVPGVEWGHGHSGVELSEEVAAQVSLILAERNPNFSYIPDDTSGSNQEGYSFDCTKKLPQLMEMFANFSPSIHTQEEEGYDWLESDDDWSRCLLIPSPCSNERGIEIETRFEFILYFAGAHSHYEEDEEGYEELKRDIEEIISGKKCAFSCSYEGWGWCNGFTTLPASKEKVKDFLRDDNEYYIRMLAEYTEKDIKKDGVYTIEMRFFDNPETQIFKFRLDELSNKIEEYRNRQSEVKTQYGD